MEDVNGYYQQDKDQFLLNQNAFSNGWKKMAPAFKKRVRVLSEPFFKTFELAKSKLNIPELYEQIETQSGTLIYGPNTICYAIENVPEGIGIHFFQFFDDDKMWGRAADRCDSFCPYTSYRGGR